MKTENKTKQDQGPNIIFITTKITILIAYRLLNTGKGSKYFLFTLYNNLAEKTGFSPFHRRSYSSDRDALAGQEK